MPYDPKKGQFVWIPTYDDVKGLRVNIAQDHERLATYAPDTREARDCLDSIERLTQWIESAGYTVEPNPNEAPAFYELKHPRASQTEKESPKEPEPNYTAYFRLTDGTTDAWDFYASSWMAANQETRRILNQEYREWV